MSDRPTRLRIFGKEEATTRAGEPPPAGAPAENPYWLDEEPAPHPDPAKGCVRRGLCCRSSPGWFAPGEVEQAAELAGLTPDAFVRSRLVVDEVEVDGERVFAFAPVKLDRLGRPAWPTGSRVDALYRMLRGVCVFFDGGGCRIYAARPFECRAYVCTGPSRDDASHEAIGRLWRDHAGAERQ